MSNNNYKSFKLVIKPEKKTIGTLSDFIYYLPEPIVNVVHISLKNAIVENFLKSINETNNKFIFSTGGTDNLITLEPGIYNSEYLLKVLKQKLPSLVVEYTEEKKISFTGTGAMFSLKFNIENSAAKILGFEDNIYNSNNNVIISTYPYNLSTENLIFIQSQELDNKIILPNQIRASNSLVLTSNSFGTSFELDDETKNLNIDFRTPHLLNKISIRLININGQVLDLNGGHMLLVFEILIKI